MDPTTISLQDLQDLKRETHIGSPTSILFLTKDQHHLYKEKRIVLLADFSTGTGFIFFRDDSVLYHQAKPPC